MGRTYSWIWKWKITIVGPTSNLSGPALFSSWMLRQMLQIGRLWAEKNPIDTFSEAWNILQLADFIWNTNWVSGLCVCVYMCVCVCVCNVLSHEKPNIWQHWPIFPQGKTRQDLDSSFHLWTGWPLPWDSLVHHAIPKLFCPLNSMSGSHLCVLSCSVMPDSLQPQRLQPHRFLCSWNFSGKNTGVEENKMAEE